ncbi:MAG: hypothetical protein SGI89_01240 [bacterium]|nr:hypothetical protein [bacterium]
MELKKNFMCSMNYLYHRVPKSVRGNILYPLNTLKEIYPDIYEQRLKNYAGRESIMQHRIPVMDCLWNDVLHFSPVYPGEVKQALIEAGRNPDFEMTSYQVDAKLLTPGNTIVFLYAHDEVKDKLNPKNFTAYNSDEVSKYSSMPQATKDYYKEIIGEGRQPLLFHRIPHILYKGTLDITDLPIVSV